MRKKTFLFIQVLAILIIALTLFSSCEKELNDSGLKPQYDRMLEIYTSKETYWIFPDALEVDETINGTNETKTIHFRTWRDMAHYIGYVTAKDNEDCY